MSDSLACLASQLPASRRRFIAWVGASMAASSLLAAEPPLRTIGPPGADGATGPNSACTSLLAALRLARAQPVVSQYLVDAGMFPLSLEPLAFRVDDLVHETLDGALVAQQLAPGQDLLVESLQAESARGRAWCLAAGSTIYHGAKVRRIEFRHPQLDARHQPATVLIDAASGLPLWHGYASMVGGYAWVYGRGPLVFPPPSTLQVTP